MIVARAGDALPIRALPALALVALLLSACALEPAEPLAPADSADSPPATPPPAPGSRCQLATDGTLTCSSVARRIGGRDLRYQTPLSPPPPTGYPLAIIFQGSFFAPAQMWSASPSSIFAGLGAYTQTRLIQRLLDDGFVVLTPAADAGGLAWDTNIPPWLFSWSLSPDHQFLSELFAALDAGELAPIDPQRWYATGVSSGGYMTSRMAVSYPGRFAALAVAAGSYATCGGPACLIPPTLPADHPPTLFLHGGADLVVAPQTMFPYRDKLLDMAIPCEARIEARFGHGWITAAPAEISRWFQSY